MSNDEWKMCSVLPRRCCRSRRVLAVVIRDERLRYVDGVGGVNKRHLSAIDNHGNAIGFSKRVECLADIFLQRQQEFASAPLIVCPRVFTFAIVSLLLFVKLIEFRLNL